MGIQIYIKTEALKNRNIELEASEEVMYHSCGCMYEAEPNAVCEMCGEVTKPAYETFVKVEGLDVIMHAFGDSTIWHDANHWGSSRGPIMEFIEKHGLKRDNDWYEA